MKGNYDTLSGLVAELERHEEVKNDFVANTMDLGMIGDTDININGVGTFDLTNHAHGQLAARLDIPRTFYNSLPDRAPELRTKIVNELLPMKSEGRMVRTLDGHARAYLSDQYRPYDNMMMLSSILPALKQFPEVQFKTNALSDTRMYMQMLFPATETRIGDLLKYGDHIGNVKAYSDEAEKLVGEALMFGVTLRNSEVGNGKFEISRTVYSMFCSNLAIGESVISKAHLGRRLDEGEYGNFQSDTIQADIDAFKLVFRDVMTNALNETAVKATLAKYASGVLGEPVADPIETVKNVTQRFNLSEGENKLVTNNFITDGRPLNQFGMGNAITALARELEDPDRSYDLERTGYNVLTLSPNEWETLSA